MLNTIPSQYLLIGSTVMAIIMGTFVMFVRMRAQKKPVNARKIIIPPIAMSTGALMFIFEEFRVAPLQIVEATAIGLIFSTVLIATSKFEVREGAIFLKRSKAFFFILVGLLVFRIVLKLIFSNSLDIGELGGMFWILAFAMLVPWRIAMLWQFKKLEKTV
ncbi:MULTISPECIES: cytochrome c biogenesis protein CcdC [Bacillales]|uniref:Cytochrome c biogenesis protein CcdC n=1 Tax=Lysinibacillus louembei TaxID=1470088 RepID=A0ABZ0RUW7_9BACI|nr:MULTISPECIES: cytochrome c biogenesis protein CcdC [Bacillales]MCT6922927.1 cytochrome c biogenesis protein CcdC [Metasolibacillus sp.]MCT6939165.1 cytochrome c biogenesis protein CcdC [Metasolibacillus sp.]WPK10991.1 cytochrome c biogenesis protein CcdC [Lysinibacillus louembei]